MNADTHPVTPVAPLPDPAKWRTPGHFTATTSGFIDAAEMFLTPLELLTYLECVEGIVRESLISLRRRLASAGTGEGTLAALAGLSTADLEREFRNVSDRLQMASGKDGTTTLRRRPESHTLVTWNGTAPVVTDISAGDPKASAEPTPSMEALVNAARNYPLS